MIFFLHCILSVTPRFASLADLDSSSKPPRPHQNPHLVSPKTLQDIVDDLCTRRQTIPTRDGAVKTSFIISSLHIQTYTRILRFLPPGGRLLNSEINKQSTTLATSIASLYIATFHIPSKDSAATLPSKEKHPCSNNTKPTIPHTAQQLLSPTNTTHQLNTLHPNTSSPLRGSTRRLEERVLGRHLNLRLGKKRRRGT